MFPPSLTVHLYSPASDLSTTFTVRVLPLTFLYLGVSRELAETVHALLGQLHLYFTG